MKRPFLFRKCRTCPYALGQVKCIISPCRECILNNRKTHPFSDYEREKKRNLPG